MNLNSETIQENGPLFYNDNEILIENFITKAYPFREYWSQSEHSN